jgi:hypothetical protein
MDVNSLLDLWPVFEEQFKIASDRVTRVEMAVYALYPFMVTLVLTVSYLK